MMEAIVQKNIYPEQEEKRFDALIDKALCCLEQRLRFPTETKFNGSKEVCNYLRLQLAQEQDEVFGALFLTTKNQFIAFEKLFQGTINTIPVFPRIIVKKAIHYNAANLIITHNHPSQNCNPSDSDIEMTQKLKKILDIIDVRLLDHIVVASQETYSLADHDLI